MFNKNTFERNDFNQIIKKKQVSNGKPKRIIKYQETNFADSSPSVDAKIKQMLLFAT